MDNRRLGVVAALSGAARAIVAVLVMIAASDINGFPTGAWTGIPVVASIVLLIMSLVFLSRQGNRNS